MLLPEYPTDELERELAALGFTTFLRTESGVPVERDGLHIMITLRSADNLAVTLRELG